MSDKQRGSFAIAADGVDPRLVPARTLASGAKMPAIGLGTFGSDRFSGEDIAAAVPVELEVCLGRGRPFRLLAAAQPDHDD